MNHSLVPDQNAAKPRTYGESVSTTPRSSGTKRRWPRVVRDIRQTRMATSVSDRSTRPWIDASEPLIATTVSAPVADHMGTNLSFTRSLRVSQDLSGSLTISQDLSQSLTVSHGRRCRGLDPGTHALDATLVRCYRIHSTNTSTNTNTNTPWQTSAHRSLIHIYSSKVDK